MKLPFEKVKRKLIIKYKDKISKLKDRSAKELINFGIVNLDKPKGPKSIHCVNKIRNLFEQPKVGHAGTLDPAVTGVLPIGLGKATKVLSVLSIAGKIYDARMHLHKEVSKDKIRKTMKKFIGKITQTPPRKAAVARKPRKREIYFIKIKKISGKDVEFVIGCQHGTYIRTLCVDVGKKLKVGAHMSRLRRLQAGPLKIKDSLTLKKVREYYKKSFVKRIILPPEKAVSYLPLVYIDDTVLPRLKHGSPVFVPGILRFTSEIKKKDTVAVFDQQSRLVALGIADMSAKQIQKAKKGLAIKTDVVLII